MLRTIACCLAAASLFAGAAHAQKVSDPKASYIDVAQRQTAFSAHHETRVAAAIAEFYSNDLKPGDLPAALRAGLEKPAFATRIGGSTTVVDGYVPAGSTKPSRASNLGSL